MTELTLEALREILRAELAPMRAELGRIAAHVDGLPLVRRDIAELRREMRALKAAFNDFAKTNVTAGEVEALHDDVDKTQDRYLELERRIMTLERITGAPALEAPSP